MPMGDPSFCKILGDQSSTHLELPLTFVSRHGKIIPKDPILRCANGEYSSQLKIEKIDGNYSFALGWNNVVKDLELGAMDFLVFRLVDKSTFEMEAYSPNCVEKVLPPKSNDVVDVYENYVDVEEEEDDDENEDDGEEDDEEEEDDENVDENEDDDDDGVDGEVNEDGDPLFTTVISTTNIYILRLPRKFMRLAGIDGERSIMLKNSNGNEWKMGLRLDRVARGRYCLSSGWQNFKRIHNLSKGDKCVFKYIKTEDKLCLVTVNGENRSSREIGASKFLPRGNGGDDIVLVKKGRGRPRKRYD